MIVLKTYCGNASLPVGRAPRMIARREQQRGKLVRSNLRCGSHICVSWSVETLCMKTGKEIKKNTNYIRAVDPNPFLFAYP